MTRIKILGSGGALRIPRACCSCKVCAQARKKGFPHKRLGQSIFIVDQNILFDTPEDINCEINKWGINEVKHIFLSHWHPDHTSGIRILETICAGRDKEPITVHLTNALEKDFRRHLPILFYLEKMKYCRISIHDEITIGELKIKSIRLNNSFAYAFLITKEEKKAIFCPCHCMDLPLMPELINPNILIMNLGYFEGNMREITGFEKDNLRLIRMLQPKKTVLTHIEESWGKSYDDYQVLEKKYAKLNLTFAFDGLNLILE